ncbi:Ig-like domain-containing protein [Epilithonimonas xixisoli]|uniref:PA14 domain-containing protein n=1 Tax=Epilithonimonas xixisoli TaxID=1476462 RepID=A0A4R8I9U8_9FLAO|nr:Ig-like domain-containing protein [Epilithonimonas xixisoli]TDX86862.1 hypothetical protein B0I22_1022 [Epilithonimonas xixisoli]
MEEFYSKNNTNRFWKILLILIAFFPNLMLSQSVPSSLGTTNCWDCVPNVGWTKVLGTPDVSDANNAAATTNGGLWTGRPLPLPPNGHTHWITIRDVGGAGAEEIIRTTISSLEIGKEYEVIVYSMAALTGTASGAYSRTYIDQFFFEIEGGTRVAINDVTQNSWGVKKLRFTATSTSRTLTFYPGANGAGTAGYEAVNISLTVNAINSVPIAVNDSRTVIGTNPITFNILTNDSDPGGSLNVNSVDLDPSTPGLQKTFSNAQGSWSVNTVGDVTFTPAPYFYGTATIPYTVDDNYTVPGSTPVTSAPATSSPANIFVFVSLDSDGDGVTDDVDLDDDNDGILDTDEADCINKVTNLSVYNGQSTSQAVLSANNITVGTSRMLVTHTTFGNGNININEISDNHVPGEVGIRLGHPNNTTRTEDNRIESNYTFSAPVSNFNFSLHDVDAGDIIRVILYDQNGNVIPIVSSMYTILTPGSVSYSTTNNYFQDTTGSDTSGTVGTIRFNLTGYLISRITLQYWDLEDTGTYSFVPQTGQECNGSKDTDGDGIPDRLDLDSDNDGCPDAIEGAGNLTTLVNSSMPGGNSGATSGTHNQPVIQNLGNTVGSTATTRGIPTVAGTGQGLGQSADATKNDCLDSDADGIPNWQDLDDDNDGILDALESPNCFYNATEANVITSVKSKFNPSAGTNIPNLYDASTATVFNFGGSQIVNPDDALLTVEYIVPVALTNLNVDQLASGLMTAGTNRFGKLFGSNDGVNYTALSAAGGGIRVDNTGIKTFPNLTPTVSYKYYQVRYVGTVAAGNTTSGIIGTGNIREITGDFNAAAYVPSANQKPGVCTSDSDGDGIPNHLDLDSDGDGCTDAIEGAATFTPANLVTATGSISTQTPNQNLGNTVNTTVGSPSYGVPTIAGAGQGLGESQNSTKNDCLDSDGDGVPDHADLDDDNDGILDAVESPNCFYTSAEANAISSVVSPFNGVAPDPLAGNNIPTLFNGSTADANPFNFAAAQTITPGTAIFTITYPTAIALSTLTVTQTANGMTPASRYGVLYGSTDGVSYVPVSNTAGILLNASSVAFTVTSSTPYRYYQIRYIGTASNGNTTNSLLGTVAIQEIASVIAASYIPSANPKPGICSADTDADGIPNHLDLDSDNDGCTDAYEGGANITIGQLVNSTGTVSVGFGSTAPNQNLGNAVNTTAGSASYGVPTIVGAGQSLGDSQNNLLNECLDSDGDGIPDVADLDDDNDGILDSVEGICTANSPLSLTGWKATVYDAPVINAWTQISASTSFPTASYAPIATFDYNEFAGTNNAFSINFTVTPYGINATHPKVINFSGTPISSAATNEDFAVLFRKTIEYREAGTYVFNLTYGDDHVFIYKNGVKVNQQQDVYNVAPLNGFATISVVAGDEISVLLVEENLYNTTINIGTSKTAGICYLNDTDGDGIPNYLDLDSDNDGCPDAIEGASTTITSSNLVNSSMPGGNSGATSGNHNQPVIQNLGNTVNTTSGSPSYGVPTIANAGQGIGNSQNSNINDCLDSDGDGVPNHEDLDDDNDGILDAIESPSCFYTSAEANVISSVVSPFNGVAPDPLAGNNIPTLFNGITADANPFNFAAAQTITPGTAIFTITYPTAIPLSTLTVTQAANGMTPTSRYGVLYGSTDGVSYVPVSSTAGVLLNTNPGVTFTVTSSTPYRYYQIRYIGTVSNGNATNSLLGTVAIQEIASVVAASYIPSANPKPGICSADTDGDGIPNHLDLDSDGDGCTDAIEGGAAFTTANLVTATGTIATQTPNQNLGNTVGNTATTMGVPTIATTGQTIGNSQSLSKNDCLDSDGDGVPDWEDLDDDNDGILDSAECPPVYADYTATTITGAADPIATVANIRWGSVTGTLIRTNNGTTVNSALNFSTLNFSNSSVFTPAGSATQSMISEGITGFNNTSNFTRYTLTLDQPVESITLQLANWDYMRTRFVGSHREERLSGGTQMIYDPVTRQLYDSDPATSSVGVETRDGYGSIRITSINGAPITQIIFERYDEPNSSSVTDGFFYTFSVEAICDSDGDGIPNRLDLDSDGDGCTDAVEGGGTFTSTNLVNASGALSTQTPNQNLGNTVGNTATTMGVPTIATTGQTVGNSQASSKNDCLDSDGDGIPDWQDVDDDNDGILDTAECSNTFGDLLTAFGAGRLLGIMPSDFGLGLGVKNQNITRDISTKFGYPANSGAVVISITNASVHPTQDAWWTKFGESQSVWRVTGTMSAFVLMTQNPEYYGSDSKTIHIYDGDTVIPITGTGIPGQDNQTPSAQWSTNLTATAKTLANLQPEDSNNANIKIGQWRFANMNFGQKTFGFSTTTRFADPTYAVNMYLECDSDMDGIPDRLDLDSDADGCSDALEGGAIIETSQLQTSGGTLSGGSTNVNQNICTTCVSTGGANIGLPQFATPVPSGYSNATGQSIGDSKNGAVAACYCTQPPAAGTGEITKVGISVQQKQEGWPQNIPNGHIVLESKEKGLVITRVAHVSFVPQATDSIATPFAGMLVYDIQDSCVKLYNGINWKCLERSCNTASN